MSRIETLVYKLRQGHVVRSAPEESGGVKIFRCDEETELLMCDAAWEIEMLLALIQELLSEDRRRKNWATRRISECLKPIDKP